ncbi:hypothetical protein SCLCIDRAFT_1212018 [Scleroderma citrinum Foug A]|uniref:Uncharacterized protein n=1 Tax=Scleroderma citrinum Foug A TaxID=1036808 RepID=A0A0C3ECG4_9AGAM|nr:hypothetical protein SCLCIDRAFT_1212018 [Scleroderma citrinum Foug A]
MDVALAIVHSTHSYCGRYFTVPCKFPDPPLQIDCIGFIRRLRPVSPESLPIVY